MNCREALSVLDDVAAGAAGGRTVQRFHEHVAGCSECRRAYRRSLAVRSVLQSEPPAWDSERHARVMNRFRTAAETTRSEPVRHARRWLLLRRPAVAAVPLTVVVGLAVLALWHAGIRVERTGDMPTADEMVTLSFLHAAHSESLAAGPPEVIRVSLADSQMPASVNLDEN